MKNQDHQLFNIFRENEHKLNERPSAQSWRQLERRLDQQRKRRRISFYRPLGMVAAVLLLVGVIAFLSTVVQKQTSTEEAIVNVPATWEELPKNNLTPADARVIAFKKQMQNKRNWIEEGKVGKKLVVGNVNEPSVNKKYN